MPHHLGRYWCAVLELARANRKNERIHISPINLALINITISITLINITITITFINITTNNTLIKIVVLQNLQFAQSALEGVVRELVEPRIDVKQSEGQSL